jgi:hypothetical protein
VIERRIWRDVVDALPAGWLDPAAQLILRRLVAQCAIAERREQRMREIRALERADDEALDALAGQHSYTAKAVAYLLGQLRASPRSRVTSRDAGSAAKPAPTMRPWDIRAPTTTSNSPTTN